uniref:Uncharacterized protein n=1 Tax=Leersia perrieri TaxID=77586 RepID=A0A0D9WI30_9ORYZ
MDSGFAGRAADVGDHGIFEGRDHVALGIMWRWESSGEFTSRSARGILDDGRCNLCDQALETIDHLMMWSGACHLGRSPSSIGGCTLVTGSQLAIAWASTPWPLSWLGSYGRKGTVERLIAVQGAGRRCFGPLSRRQRSGGRWSGSSPL